MRLPDPKHTWDVVIVAAPGRATDIARELEGHLVQRSLRVKLQLITGPSALPLPKEIEESARQTACCVALAARYSESDDGAERIAYAIMPAPRFAGQLARFAKPGAKPASGETEIGMVEGDLRSLVERIAARFGRSSG